MTPASAKRHGKRFSGQSQILQNLADSPESYGFSGIALTVENLLKRQILRI